MMSKRPFFLGKENKMETFTKKKAQLDALLDELSDMTRLKRVKLPARAWTAKMEADYKRLRTKASKLEDEVSEMYKVWGSMAAAAKADEEDARETGPSRSTGRLEPTQPAPSALFKGLVAGSTRKRTRTRRRKTRGFTRKIV